MTYLIFSNWGSKRQVDLVAVMTIYCVEAWKVSGARNGDNVGSVVTSGAHRNVSFQPIRGAIAEALTNQSPEIPEAASAMCHTLIPRASEDLILLHILQKSDQRDTEPTWENICVTPFKYFLYQRKIFPMILKLFQ